MPKKILLIDDDPDIHRQTENAVKKAGHHLISALNGPEGIELAKKEEPDLVILDHLMPSMDGLTVYRILIEQYQNPERSIMPVIMLSGAEHGDDQRAAILESGINAYLQKPFGGKELINVIENVLVTSGITLRSNKLIKAVMNSKNFLESLVESCPVLIITTDENGRISYVNRKVQECLGHQPEALIGSLLPKLIPMHSGILQRLLGEKNGSSTGLIECSVPSLTGQQIPLAINYSHLADKQDNSLGLLAVGQDLTTQKELEKERIEKERLKAITESLATINHQINNPLMPILGNIQLMRRNDGYLEQDDKRKLEIIEINAKKISKIIREFNEAQNLSSVSYYGKTKMLEL